ncbi:MAG: DJ-1/PfpI family protein [bacterium]|nr:DJ-1/PfpI family protein [bacterium]MDY2830691.1 DJ-1 family glyoxalase III [Alphaproteobacteria bacterium]
MSTKSVCILLADGFEEVEALMPADILKRLNVKVILAGVESLKVRGAHDFYICAESLMKDVDVAEIDAVILPGGLPGAINLRESQEVSDFINLANENGKICAAICAAPVVLRDSGAARGKHLTGYPETERLSRDPAFRYTGKDVETDGNIITAKGMGKAAAFAFAIARGLGIAEERVRGIAEDTFISD